MLPEQSLHVLQTEVDTLLELLHNVTSMTPDNVRVKCKSHEMAYGKE